MRRELLIGADTMEQATQVSPRLSREMAPKRHFLIKTHRASLLPLPTPPTSALYKHSDQQLTKVAEPEIQVSWQLAFPNSLQGLECHLF